MSEAEHEAELDLLRAVETFVGVSGIVPPKAGATNAPTATPVVPPPGPVAEVPADAVAPISTFPGVAAPEEANAFVTP